MMERDATRTVIVDDFHLADSADQHRMLDAARDGRFGRVVLVTQQIDPALHALYKVRDSMQVISAENLAFSLGEVAELLACESGGSHDQAYTVHTATGGQPMLTRMLLNDQGVRAEHIVGEWLAHIVPAAVRSVVLRWSLAPLMDESLATRLTPGIEATEALDMVEQWGMGKSDPEGVFAFHPTVLTAARRIASREVSAREQEELRRTSLAWLFTHPSHSQHITSDLFRWYYPEVPYSATGHPPRDAMQLNIAPAVELLPSNTLPADHKAKTMRAILQSVDELVPSVEVLAIVRQSVDHLLMLPPERDREAAVYRELAILSLLWSAKRYGECAARRDVLLRAARELDPHLASGVWPATYSGLLSSSVASTLTCDMTGAEALLLAQGADHDPRRRARRRIQHAFILAMRGEVSRARHLLDAESVDRTGAAEWDVRLAVTQAAILLESGTAHDALRVLQGVEPDLARSPDWPYALIVTARSHLAIDPILGAVELSRLMAQHGTRPMTPELEDLLRSALADLAAASGDVVRARKLLNEGSQLRIAQRLTAARLGLAHGDRSAASDLERLLEDDDLWPRLQAQAYLLLSVYRYRAGNEVYAADALKSALAIADGHGIRLIQSLVPKSDLAAIAQGAGLALPQNVNQTNPMESALSAVTLTQRESVLLHHLATPIRLRDIADEEFVSLNTVKSQAASVYRKLGAKSREAAVREALRRGLLKP
ncbi:LuxR C-terminal-related transcriptional regulator [Microbacterium sp. GXS0129]|uniref:helix-turn-helix transcriptional regulator n=1 Tax=Microbacterium sp. GXS0129 TaxID=3377836 RepID=UPI003839D8DD